MFQFSKASDKPGYLFGKLPNYFHEKDNYRPNAVVGYENDGLLERYLEIFCNELDENFSPYVDSIGYLFDATGLSNIPGADTDRFLIHISDSMGNPPDIGTDDQYKILLRYLVHILKRKGNREALDMYLALLGYQVSDIVLTPYESPIYDKTPTPFKYDDGNYYDMVGIWYYDMELVITDLDGTTTGDPGSEWLLDLKKALQNFLLPITVNLVSVTYVSP